MKRTVALVLGVPAAVAVFADVSEPAATTVYGLTPRRLWVLRPQRWRWLAWSSAGCRWCPPSVISAIVDDATRSWPW
jgi:hypothetical protein